MPITVQFDHGRKLARVHFSGEITPADFSDYMQRWGQHELTDYDELVTSDAGLRVNISLLMQHARDVLQLDPYFDKTARTALVDNPDNEFSYGKFWAETYAMTTDNGREVKVFSNEADALDWLTSERV